MIIIRVLGGYGNQLFNYAIAKKFQANGKSVRLDWSFFDSQTDANDYREPIKNYINIDIKEASRLDLLICKLINKVRREPAEVWEEMETISEVNSVLDLDGKILVGYWQNQVYCNDCKDTIVDYLTEQFDNHLNSYSKQCKQEIRDSEHSVAIHVRGGDYLKQENVKTFGDICNKWYYEEAIKLIHKTSCNTKYYVFTNDRKYAEELLPKGIEYNYISNTENDGYMDMYLMSICDDIIIANSTFSWWGAYLKKNEEGIIVAPKKWKNRYVRESMLCEGWKTV